MEKINCPICGSKASSTNMGGNLKIDCPRCDLYKISTEARLTLQNWSDEKKSNLSSWVFEHPNCHLTVVQLETIAELQTPLVGEKADKLLLYLAKRHPKPGEKFSLSSPAPCFNPSKGGQYISEKYATISWAQDQEELHYLLNTFLDAEKSLIKINASQCEITPQGWNYIEELRHGNPNSKIGFIAMWFDDSMKDAEAAIHKGIEKAGYDPKIVNREEHNNKIDDEIIALVSPEKERSDWSD